MAAQLPADPPPAPGSGEGSDAAPASRGAAPRPAPPALLDQIARGEHASWGAERLVAWAIERFHPRLVLSASFGAPEGMVLLDLLHRIEPAVRVFTLDTGRLPQATHDLIDRVRDRYGVEVEVVFPDPAAVVQMVRRHGQNLFYETVEKRQLCCRTRKVEPMQRYFASAGVDAWIAGLRREQGVTRQEAAAVEVDATNGGIVKINPLVDWTHERVWEYVREHNVPVNRLHREGYPSVGCEPCSRAIRPGEDVRAGRWWWENPETRECGIHVEEESHGSGI